ncbi:hypothetical protein A2961_01975 [Candidatus Woesebacteria bacterium RIFCSPLOWO2_01_FULL_39_21]|uniref:Uncharacterized protein n=1 Tax=Candidatus Woesebacteria bacterium RIFCSPLOWO2_01_FULL_39_21 TaxID=1802519 RepID=A0A1F8BGW1_9BACT|nr:MAG: hypothetical protein A2691_04395 [Candidatus Woesebacteria bacterium RIFCSPHIGHO2_01_FULL_39_23]OGM63297.1 MAG: hypothetical protein A2961_01975 [Candidatus Woesebacteria bacterium RIFCSPLOWO2_01_FULL_39_21]
MEEYSSQIKVNLDKSTKNKLRLYTSIFSEYYSRLMTDPKKAEYYLAQKMGVLDNYFHLYFIALASELKKSGKVEASSIMENKAKLFLENLKSFQNSHITDFVEETSKAASKILINSHSKSLIIKLKQLLNTIFHWLS